ncbi:hypothetical protein [Pelagibius sp. Alg239-R121]|uniref:hypothetical protein n=1 Tax=Pelagibius sp. Alg239-R121 TaxID=2993448 RepID=UPI0024A74938|nr:hypothetical protein [Pelagibius sp. Alg239-R121]
MSGQDIVIDRFSFKGEIVETWLCKRGDIFIIRPWWQDGDRLTLFELSVEGRANLTVEAATHSVAFKRLAVLVREGIVSGQWLRWEREVA